MPRSEWRALLTLAAAIVLPLAVFIALQGAFTLRQQRLAIEEDAAARARQIDAETDGLLWADRSALEVLATSNAIRSHDWAGAYARLKGVTDARPRWQNVVLTDARTGRELFETRAALPQAERPARPAIARYLASKPTTPVIAGIGGAGPGCPCVTIHAPVLEDGRLAYVLTVELGTADFQAILMSHSGDAGVSAIVDRDGLFIARTVDSRARLGKPATRYVRDAIAARRGGLYRGVTFEGMKNFTSFETSDLSGWSAHIAMDASRLSAPMTAAWLLTGLSALLVLALAAGLGWFALRQVAEQRREMEAKAQSQKLAAIGQLASGVAHDFNNLLQVISGSLDLIGRRCAEETIASPLKNAKDAAERGATLTRQLLDFARAQPADMGPVDLDHLLRRISGLLAQTLGPGVTLEIKVEPTAAHVVSNAGQLELALLNLAVNARDAMPDGGTLTIETAPAKAAGRVTLAVRDTGEGMPPDVLERALEPFFTTKPTGKGTGLGLAQVFGIVSHSGGTVDLESVEGLGTVVTLTLPAA
jgi:signal transduction histidine kinase